MMDGNLGDPCSRPRLRVRAARAGSLPDDPLARLSDALQHLVKEAEDKPKPSTVHRLRTTIRRFETVLPEAGEAPVRGKRKLRKQLDRIRKRAGKVRDVDVHLRALRTLGKESEGDERVRVRQVLEKARAKRRKRLAEVIDAERDRGLMKRIRQVVGSAVTNDAARRADPLPVVIERFRELRQSVGELNEAKLHEFRIDTKRLRYLAETAAPSREARVATTQLKRIQDAIGAWHDWRTLTERTAEVLGSSDGSSPLLTELAARTQAKLEKAIEATAGAAGRLARLERLGPRKAGRPVSPAASVPVRSLGVSA